MIYLVYLTCVIERIIKAVHIAATGPRGVHAATNANYRT